MHAATAHGGFSVTHSRLQAKSRQKVTSLRSGAFLSLWRWLWKPTRVGLDSGPCRLCLFLSMRFLLSLFLYEHCSPATELACASCTEPVGLRASPGLTRKGLKRTALTQPCAVNHKGL